MPDFFAAPKTGHDFWSSDDLNPAGILRIYW